VPPLLLLFVSSVVGFALIFPRLDFSAAVEVPGAKPPPSGSPTQPRRPHDDKFVHIFT
jgi:hypothetical protein